MRGVAGSVGFVLLQIIMYLHFLNIEYQEVAISPNTISKEWHCGIGQGNTCS